MGSNIETEPSAQTRRMFFALWPSAALSEQIEKTLQPLLERRQARVIPRPNLHITLAFLGSISEGAIANVVEAANQIGGAPFDFTIDRMETWRRAHVACLTIEPTPPPLAVLVERLRFSLLARKVAADPKEYKAHVTVARDWHDKPVNERVGPFQWQAQEFVLAESRAGRAGSEYTIVRRWPLAAEVTQEPR